MGIQGLLPLLKSIMVPIHIKELEGCSVAVDTYSWLHKGALSCSIQLCKGQPTSRHIDYCMHRVNLLRHNGVKPILVFDGGFLPMKGEQENKRARARKENLQRAMEHESNGNSAAAYDSYQKAVDISPSVAYELIQVLKQENVQYVVAPYEADSQMTFLAVTKQVEAVITEDSDLIPFGCPRIIFKMDKFGQGVEFRNSMLQQNKELSFVGFTKQMILEMCILSGCDYLQSLPGMGLKRAHALIKKFNSYDKVIKHLRYSTVSVPPLYEESFKKAIWTFQHQRVYDPMVEDIIHLYEPSDNIGDDLDFLGPSMPQHIAKGIAQGNLDPITKMPFQGGSAISQTVPDTTYQLKNFKPGSDKKKIDLPAQKNLVTNYFCFASLEAKRKFRAPRTTPKSLNPLDGSSPSAEHAMEEAAVSKINSSPGSPFGSGNLGSVSPENFVEGGLSPKAPELSEFSNHVGLNDVADVVADTKGRAQALLQQFSYSIHKPCISLHKERKCSYVLDAVEGKTRIENRKVIVRSSYFQPKVVDENDCDSKSEMLSVKNDIAIDTSENTIPERPSSEQNSLKGTGVKRKVAPIDNFQTEYQESHVQQSNASLSDRHSCSSDLDDTSVETKTKEGKFGCDISHLGQYSEISEKSMEKFVSVISSFRCSSSGSRASGLRAPLKDIRNTYTHRSNVSADLSEFSYVPNKGRTASAAHRA